MANPKDQRRVQTEPDRKAHARLLELSTTLREAALEAAEIMAQVEGKGAHLRLGASSMYDYAVNDLGLEPAWAHLLRRLGRAFQVEPELRPRVEDRRLSMEAAAAVSRILARPDLHEPGEDWIAVAEDSRHRDLRRRIKARLARGKAGEPVEELMFHVPGRTVDGFRRVREVLSQRERRVIDTNEAFSMTVEAFLDTCDPLRVQPGRRRMEPTSERPWSRGVPAEVKRAALQATEGGCLWPQCSNRLFIELAHLEAYASGGDQELANVIPLCGIHHKLRDLGFLKIERVPGGRIRFEDAEGRDWGTFDWPPKKAEPPPGQ